MPKVTQVRAAKDYPDKGIKKGEQCYVWRIKLARGGMDCRSKTFPRPSQLNLGFAGQIGDIELDMGKSQDVDELRAFAEQLRELGQEQQEKLDNMPEGLQQGDTGQLLQERADSCESWANEVESACDEYDEAISRINEMSAEDLDLDEETREDGADVETAREEKRQEAFHEAVEAATNANPGF
jgi:PAS domain-containing protein